MNSPSQKQNSSNNGQSTGIFEDPAQTVEKHFGEDSKNGKKFGKNDENNQNLQLSQKIAITEENIQKNVESFTKSKNVETENLNKAFAFKKLATTKFKENLYEESLILFNKVKCQNLTQIRL